MKASTCQNGNLASVDSAAANPRVISTGLPALDSKIDGGLRLGRVTELVGPAPLTHLIAQSCIASNTRNGRPVAIIDYVHDIGVSATSLANTILCQPDNLAILPRLVSRLIAAGVALIVIFIGDEVRFHRGIPQSTVDRNLTKVLQQLPWGLASGNAACLAITEQPIMPNGPTVIRAVSVQPENGRLCLEITAALDDVLGCVS